VSATNAFLVPIWGDYDQKKTLDITFEYDNNGVLIFSSISYGGIVAHTLELKVVGGGGSPQIPGYGLLSLLGASVTAGVSIVFIVKRKKLLK
jgi:hypothetical protein